MRTNKRDLGPRLVRARFDGPADAVALCSARLRVVLNVARESGDVPNRRDPGIRRYLDILVNGGDLLTDEVERRG
jgi:hypothetical protein